MFSHHSSDVCQGWPDICVNQHDLAAWPHAGSLSIQKKKEIILSMSNTSVLKKLYFDHLAPVLTDVTRRVMTSRLLVEQSKVTIIAAFYNSVLQTAMQKDIGSRNENGLGIKLGDEKRDCISNLRFADAVLMMANSLKQLKRMMTDFKRCKGLKFTQTQRKYHQSEIKQDERNRG